MIQTLTTRDPAAMPSEVEVRQLYAAASAEPPLSENGAPAALFASIYGRAMTTEPVTTTTIRDGDRLVAFAYGQPWHWAQQRYPWADELSRLLGSAAAQLEGSYSLALLARDPERRGDGLGRSVLQAWLGATGDASCWLQTTDADTPARGLYGSLGFAPIGFGPDGPDGRPGLVMLRDAAPGESASAPSASHDV